MPSEPHQWSNESVIAFSDGNEPLARAHGAAEELLEIVKAHGLNGPPVDVFALAGVLGIGLRPKDDLLDAQISAFDGGRLLIEYNPSRPKGRLRFSLAHEIAHSRFADVADRPRHRTAAGSVADPSDNAWELELVCDVIAADLLIPSQAVEGLLTVDPDIDFIMEARRRWDVSTEALLRRLVTSTPRSLVLIAASRPAGDSDGAMRVDYLVSSATAASSPLVGLGHGDRLIGVGPLLDCSAVGQTVRGDFELAGEHLYLQAVGVPPYPGNRWPRVLALVEPHGGRLDEVGLDFVVADLLDVPGGASPIVFAHVVSDSVRRWNHFGVAGALSRSFGDFAQAFRAWTIASSANLELGHVHYVERQLDGRQVGVASLVAQEGFGSGGPRIRYNALEAALDELAEIAISRGAEVHVPRLGAGQAGGRWDWIEAALLERLVKIGVKVVVHTQPVDQRQGGPKNA